MQSLASMEVNRLKFKRGYNGEWYHRTAPQKDPDALSPVYQLCGKVLSEFFKIPKRVREIDIVWSKEKNSNAYYVRSNTLPTYANAAFFYLDSHPVAFYSQVERNFVRENIVGNYVWVEYD